MRYRLPLVALLASVSLLAHQTRAAEACTCGDQGQVVPARGVTDVPLNVQVLVNMNDARYSQEGFGLRRQDTQEQVGSTVTTPDAAGFRVTPMAPLDSNTVYEVTYDDTRDIEVISSFTTGAVEDTQPPRFTGTESVSAEVMGARGGDSYNSCVATRDGPFPTLRLRYDASDSDLAYVLLDFHSLGGASTKRELIIPETASPGIHTLRALSCSNPMAPYMTVGNTYCVRLTAVDMAGNESVEPTELCVEAKECAPAWDEQGWPLDTCEAPQPPDTGGDGSDGGCSTSGSHAGWLTPLLLVLLWRPRRRRT